MSLPQSILKPVHSQLSSSQSSSSQSSSKRRQRGMVTLELAVGLLAAVMLLAIGSGVIGLIILQDRCRDIAGMIAREHARNDQQREQVARGQAPRGASIVVAETDGWVRVKVTATRSWGRLGPVTVSGEAVVPAEGEQ